MNPVLKKAYNNCKPDEYLKWNDDRYVSLSAMGLRGSDGDIVAELEDAIAIADGEAHLLFSGFRGSGKTTELLRLQHQLEKNGYVVVYVDTDEYLNLTVPATVSDLWISIAAGFSRFLMDKKYIDNTQSFWKRLQSFLEQEIKIENFKFGVSGVAELELSLKQNSEFRDKLNKALEDKRPRLVKECRGFLDESIGEIARKNPATLGTVLILDSFEKLQGDARNEDEVRQSVETMFIRDWKLLKTPCHAIYTVPSWLSFTETGADCDLGRTYLLPMCKVSEREKNDDGGYKISPYQGGIDAMLDLLGKRMNLEQIFGGRKQVEPLVILSGGYPRDLLRMIREVILRNTKTEALPISPEKLRSDIDRVIEIYTESYELGLDGADLPLLCKVAINHSLSGWTGKDKLRLARLFDRHFVLSYQNGEKWLDLHPLLSNTSVMKNALEECKAEKDKAKEGEP
ncbi:MAG: AAA family ATPase [Deltaproteobacteria bacterium]|nr:AAA family ATPase [Deltaproteobacteria bacterium]